MKQILTTALIALLTAVCSCRSDSGTIDLLPAKPVKSASWSLIDPDGICVIADTLPSAPTMAIGGFYAVESSRGIKIVATGQGSDRHTTLIDNLSAAGTMTLHRMPVVKPNSRIMLINESGDSIATLNPIGDYEIDAVSPFFASERMIFHLADDSANGHFGAIDTDGNIAIDPIFDLLYPFHGNYALAAIVDTDQDNPTKSGKKSNLTYHFIDRSGKIKQTLPQGMTPLSEGLYRDLMPVDYADTLGFVNINGQFRPVADGVKKITDATDHIFTYSDPNGKNGAMTIEGDTIIAPKYKSVTIINDSRLIAIDRKHNAMLYDNRGNILDTLSNIKSAISLNDEYPFSSKFRLILQTTDNTYYIYDPSGKNTDRRYSEISTRIIIKKIQTKSGEMVPSDYFDLNSAATRFTSAIHLTGYGQASLKQQIGQLTSQKPENFTTSYSLRYSKINESRYKISATAYSNETIALKEPIYDDHSDSFFGFLMEPELTGYDYKFNPQATISKIVVQLTSESTTFNEMRSTIESGIDKAGFDKTSSTAAYTTFAFDDVSNAILLPAPMQKGAILYILTRSAYNSNLSAIRREAEINFAL